jgi:hypothetical protein
VGHPDPAVPARRLDRLLRGRPAGDQRAPIDLGGRRRIPRGHPAPRVAPDDDPEFLSRIDRQQKREQEDLLQRWEDDLRRREENLRKKEDLPPTDG